MGACSRYSRRSLICTTFIIFCGSMVVFGYGLWCLMYKSSMQQILGNDNYLHTAYVLLTAGGAAGFLSLIGCIGAWKRNSCLLLTYFIIVLVILTLAITGVILGLMLKPSIEKQINSKFIQSIRDYDPDNNSTLTLPWDAIQKTVKCCGYNSPNDWKNKNPYFSYQRPVPLSCCNTDGKLAYYHDNCKPEDNYYKVGCKSMVLEYFAQISFYVAVVGGVVGFLMIMVLTCSIIVFKSDDYESY